MKAFYASRLSDHISQTPEGYLVCTNVPIARTGWQDYGPGELGLNGDSAVHVWRDPEEVFDQATIASFEGKSITDGHPPEFVGPANENAYHRGHVQHVRRGRIDGTNDEVLLADLIVKDANLISKIQAGLREISCGYECEYVPMSAVDYDYRPTNGNGNYSQRDIRGNHIAVVSSGRAGDKVRIRDSAEERGKPIMNLQRHIFGLGLKAFTKDADPEAVANAVDDFNEKAEAQTKKRNEDDDDKKTKDDDDKTKDEKKMTDSAINKLIAVVDRLDKTIKGMKAQDDDETITTDDDEKEKTDDDACDDADPKEEEEEKESEDADLIPVMTLGAGERPHNPIPGADALKQYLLRTKPFVARSKDKKAIQQWNQAWTALKPRSGRTKDGYRKLLDRKKPDEVQFAEDRVRTTDTQDPYGAADFVAQLKPYHRQNIVEVSQRLELEKQQAKRKEKVN